MTESTTPAIQTPTRHARPQAQVALGAELAAYVRPRRVRRLIGAILLAALSGGIAVGYAVWLYMEIYAQYGPAAALARSRPYLVIAAVAVLAGLLLILSRLSDWFPRVVVYTHGVLVQHGIGRRRYLPFKKIAGISVRAQRDTFLGRTLQRSFRIRLHPTTGRGFWLPGGLEDPHAIADHLRTLRYPALLAALQAEHAAGKALHFGPITVEDEALILPRRKTVPLDSLQRLVVEAGWLVIEWDTARPGSVMQLRRQRLAAERIPNLELLFQIVQPGEQA